MVRVLRRQRSVDRTLENLSWINWQNILQRTWRHFLSYLKLPFRRLFCGSDGAGLIQICEIILQVANAVLVLVLCWKNFGSVEFGEADLRLAS